MTGAGAGSSAGLAVTTVSGIEEAARTGRWGPLENHAMTFRRIATIVAALVLAVVSTHPASAARGDSRSQRERVRQRRAEVARQVDALKAEDAQVRRALDAIDDNLTTQQAYLSDAQRAVASAAAQLERSRAEEAAAAAQIRQVEGDIEDLAIQAYMGGSDAGEATALLEATDFNEVAVRTVMRDAVVGSTTEARDRLRAAREDLEVARREAERAAAAADVRRAEVAQRVRQVRQARDAQARFADAVEVRIESRLAEAASLSAIDSRLSAQIAREQADLARRNRGRRGGGVSGAPYTAGNVRVRSVRGIVVHESIADQVERLLAAAEADGIVFGGGGYRDPSSQWRLREQNCPDARSSPASSCRPPTARPGQSMHERGLAIDFTYQGRVISSRSNPGYRWLAANAGRYGLKNLPSEPWHWSTNGN